MDREPQTPRECWTLAAGITLLRSTLLFGAAVAAAGVILNEEPPRSFPWPERAAGGCLAFAALGCGAWVPWNLSDRSCLEARQLKWVIAPLVMLVATAAFGMVRTMLPADSSQPPIFLLGPTIALVSVWWRLWREQLED